MAILVAVFGAAVLAFLVVGYSILSWGWVLFKFYNWFVLTVFINLPHIDFWQAVGLSLFTTLLKNHNVDTKKDEHTDKSKLWLGYIMPWLVLLVGWIFYSLNN